MIQAAQRQRRRTAIRTAKPVHGWHRPTPDASQRPSRTPADGARDLCGAVVYRSSSRLRTSWPMRLARLASWARPSANATIASTTPVPMTQPMAQTVPARSKSAEGWRGNDGPTRHGFVNLRTRRSGALPLRQAMSCCAGSVAGAVGTKMSAARTAAERLRTGLEGKAQASAS